MPKIVVFEVPRGPGGVKMGPQKPLGPFLERLGLMDASWSGLRPFGALLDGSRTKKNLLDRLSAAPRGSPREISAILRAKALPKRTPGGSKIGSRRRLELKSAKSKNFEDVS